jgi:hypothetical protein
VRISNIPRVHIGFFMARRCSGDVNRERIHESIVQPLIYLGSRDYTLTIEEKLPPLDNNNIHILYDFLRLNYR